jgi:hypothetical protein
MLDLEKLKGTLFTFKKERPFHLWFTYYWLRSAVIRPWTALLL